MVWRKLNYFDGRFEVNDDGDIRNTNKGRQLSYYINNKGYRITDLNYNGKRKKILIHRAVAEAFIPNPNNYPVVMHLDDNPLNCNVSNLKWGTYLDNNRQAIDEGHIKVPKPDNRKYYCIYDYFHAYDPIICNGIKEAISIIGFGTDSSIRNYIFRATPIPYGKYAGWYITKCI